MHIRFQKEATKKVSLISLFMSKVSLRNPVFGKFMRAEVRETMGVISRGKRQ